jgi:hypothetical protein
MKGQFEQTVASMKQMTAQGASFAGGMTEMRQVANASGVGLTAFTNIVVKSRENLQTLGISATETTHLLSKGMDGLGRSIKGANGQMTTTRDQLLALGYSYEEQGEVMSLYMQQQAIAGKNLKNLAPEELAAGTKEYAKNLKLISDITGQDAKKLVAKAQAETMRAALMNKLDPKQKEAFVQAWSGAAVLGEEAATKQRLAMMQKLSGGASNVAEVVGDQNANKFNDEMVAQVRAGTATAESIKNSVVTTAKAIDANSSKAVATGQATLYGVQGANQAMSSHTDAFLAVKNADITDNKKIVEAQTVTQDAATVAYSQATNSVTQFQVAMQELASVHMADYAKIMVSAIQTVQTGINEGIKMAKDPKGYAEAKAKEAGDATVTWWDKNKTAIITGLTVAAGTAALATGVGAPVGAMMISGALATGGAAAYGVSQITEPGTGAALGNPTYAGGKPNANANAPGDYHAAFASTLPKTTTKAPNQPAHDAVTQQLMETNKHLKQIADGTVRGNQQRAQIVQAAQ